MIAHLFQFAGLAFVILLVTVEALYFVIVPLLLIGVIVHASWERIREGIEHYRDRKQARKLLGDLRVLG